MDEYTDEQSQEWTKEDLLNLPLEDIENLRENKRVLIWKKEI